MESVCTKCFNYRYFAGRIHMDPDDDEMPYCECAEDMENFMTAEGCYQFDDVGNHERGD